MKESHLTVLLCVMMFCSTLFAAQNCAPTHRCRRSGSTARRYQPKTYCEDCEPHHRYLLLLGINAMEEKLKRCSVYDKIEGYSNLSSVLSDTGQDTIVLIIPNVDWDIDNKIIDAIIDKLGNLSLFITGQLSGNNLKKRCRHFGNRCFIIDNLLPVITQLEALNKELSIVEQDVTTALLDLYNARWNEDVLNVTINKTRYNNKVPTVHRQMDTLLAELCKREFKNNRIVKITKSTEQIASNSDDGIITPERSLSLNDILPLDPKSYDKNRPPKQGGSPTVVYFHVTVLSLDSINEESMTYVADIFLAQSWRDSRLRLPENMSEEYRIIDVEWLKYIWRPDCFFKNAKKVTFHEMSIPNHYLWLYHDKTLLYMAKLTLVLSCAMKFESYPHDTQSCSMMIESLSHTTQDLKFKWNVTDPLVVNPDIELPQLDISNNYTTDCTLTYSTGNFTCISVVFTLRRRLGYHLFHTYIPSALIVVMSWISFWIKPEAIPARVTLGVTSLLTLGEIFSATQNTQSQQSLPPVSYVKAIDVWMSSCSVFVFLSLMEFAIVNYFMGPIATKAMKGFSEEDLRSAIDDCRDSTRGRAQARMSVNTVPQYATCFNKVTAIYIDKLSRFLFPFSFLILNVVYWLTFL